MYKAVDVIVIGAGFAGLSAAIEAKLQGKDVVVFEKMARIGGNSVISDGGIAATNTDLQEKYGIEDSRALMKKDIMKAGKYRNDEKLVDLLVDHAHEAFVWTRDFLGVEYLDRVDIFGGHSVPRCYTPVHRSGRDLIKALERKCNELNIEIKTKTYVEDFIVEDLCFKGVNIVSNYQYRQNQFDNIVPVYAKNGIVLTTGGYGQNKKLIEKYAQDFLELDSTNKPTANNHLLVKLLDYPIKMVDLDQVQLLPSTSIDEKGFGEGSLFGDYIVFPYGILVDSKTINRFVSELSNRGELSEEIIKHHPYCYGIADQKAVNMAGWNIEKGIKKGVVKKCETIEDLSSALNCSVHQISETLKKYNFDVEKGIDQDFQKPITNQKTLDKFPFYVMRMFPKIHYTMGGLSINEFGQVLDNSEKPIKGLYAAGETTGGIHGTARLGSMAVTDCIVFGRIVGKNV